MCKQLKKLSNMKMTVIPIVIGALGTIPKSLEQRLVEQEIRERIETNLDHSSVKIGLNTKKGFGDLKRLVLT